MPEGRDRRRFVFGFGQRCRRWGEAHLICRFVAGPVSLGQDRAQGQGSGRRPCDGHCGGQVAAGDEGGDIVAPPGPPALVAGQVDIGAPAAGHRQAIGLDALAARQRDRADAVAARGIDNAPAHDDGGPAQGVVGGCRRRAVAGVDHRGDGDAPCGKIGGGAPAVVGVGEDRHPLARRHPPAVDVGPHRARQHDAGAVVVAKSDWPLGGSGA